VQAEAAHSGGIAWLACGAYESLMQARILCSGECTIRVDLLLIYPALLVLTRVRHCSRGGAPAETS
ncbi:MAG: hypothetical protein ACREMA_19275, partial [Longimicrobiales bacterium]